MKQQSNKQNEFLEKIQREYIAASKTAESILAEERAKPLLEWLRKMLVEASYPPPPTQASISTGYNVDYNASDKQIAYFEGRRAAIRELLTMAKKI